MNTDTNQLTPTDISIIVPVYNGGELFARCLDALASLAPPPGEIIVVDDGSSDGTPPRSTNWRRRWAWRR